MPYVFPEGLGAFPDDVRAAMALMKAGWDRHESGDDDAALAMFDEVIQQPEPNI